MKKAKINYLTKPQLDSFFKAIKEEKNFRARNLLMFTLIYEYGLRASEVQLLKLNSYNPSGKVANTKDTKGTITIAGLKGGQTVTYPVKKKTAELIYAWLRRLPADYLKNPENPLLPSSARTIGRTGVSRYQVDYLMRKYAKAANLPANLQHPHVLRHSCAVHMRDKGIDIASVSNWLRHQSISTTQVYFTASDYVVAKVADRFFDEEKEEKIKW